jgi:hypothetical protein
MNNVDALGFIEQIKIVERNFYPEHKLLSP